MDETRLVELAYDNMAWKFCHDVYLLCEMMIGSR